MLRNDSYLIILTPILAFVYWMLNVQLRFFEPVSVADFGLWGNIAIAYNGWWQLVSVLFVVLNAFIVNYTFNHYNFQPKNTFFPAFVYVIWMSFFEDTYLLNGLLLSHLVCVLILFQFLRLKTNEDGRRIVFNASFLGGIAVTLSPFYLFLFPFFYFLLVSIRPIVWREFALCFCGFMLPIVYAFIFRMFVGLVDVPFVRNWTANTFWYQRQELVSLCVIAICFFVVCLIGLRLQLLASTVQFRKITHILLSFILALLCVGGGYLWWNSELNGFSTSMVGVAMVSAFGRKRRWVSYCFLFFLSLTILGSVFKFFL